MPESIPFFFFSAEVFDSFRNTDGHVPEHQSIVAWCKRSIAKWIVLLFVTRHASTISGCPHCDKYQSSGSSYLKCGFCSSPTNNIKGIHYKKGAKANNTQERGKDRAAKGEGGITGRMRVRGGQKKEEEGREGRKHR